MSWKCPACGGHEIMVIISTVAILTQSQENFETEVQGDHEWDEESRMDCRECDFIGKAGDFEHHEPVRAEYLPAQFRIMDRDDLYFLLSLAAQEMDNTKEGDGFSNSRLEMERNFNRVRDEIQCPSRHESIVGILKA